MTENKTIEVPIDLLRELRDLMLEFSIAAGSVNGKQKADELFNRQVNCVNQINAILDKPKIITTEELEEQYRLKELYYDGYLGVTEKEYVDDYIMRDMKYKMARLTNSDEFHLYADSFCTDLIIKYVEPFEEFTDNLYLMLGNNIPEQYITPKIKTQMEERSGFCYCAHYDLDLDGVGGILPPCADCPTITKNVNNN